MKLKMYLILFVLCMMVNLTLCRCQINPYLDTFEAVWKKVNDTYYDSTFNGFNWKDAHDRYLPQIVAVEYDQDFYRLVNKMLWEMRVSHTNLIPPGNLARSEPMVCAEGSPGFDIRLLDGQAVITSVKQGSPAREAGLHPGYVIRTIDEVPVDQLIQEAESLMRPPYNTAGRTGIITKAIISRIYGAPGNEVSVTYLNETGDKSEKKLMRVKRSGKAVGPGGVLYLAVDFEARMLDNGIGYLRLNTFQPPLAPRISGAIKLMGNVPAIIFDLRGNAGGEIEEMPDLFLIERTMLFLRRSRNGETKMFFDPAENAYKGPLVLLIDQLSGSACELFAGCLQAAGRAVIVGERSPGAVMESDMMVLPDGSILMHPVAQPVLPDGTVIEGRGVVPDIEIELDRVMLQKGTDSQIEAAIRYIEKEILK